MKNLRQIKIVKLTDLTLIVIFLLLTGAVPIGFLFNFESKRVNGENRKLKSFPVYDWNQATIKSFPSEFEKYYNDHFCFRNDLIHWHNWLYVFWMGTSPKPHVILGKKNWLFYNGIANSDGDPIADCRGTRPLSQQNLDRWKEELERRQKWLAERNIYYLFIIPPNKEQIYQEYLPEKFSPIKSDTPVDQLMRYLKNQSKIDILDLRPIMYQMKNQIRIYHRTDTHWNSVGAFIAYQEIIRIISKWFPAIKPRNWSDFKIINRIGLGGDLSLMLNLEDKIREEHIELISYSARQATFEIGTDNSRSFVISKTNNSNFPRAVIFRDSFGTALIPFLSENFQRAYYQWNLGFDQDLIKKEHPDLVIQEIVERYIRTNP